MIELEAQRKEKERQKEVTEAPKRFMMQEMARGFYLFEEALLVFLCVLLKKDLFIYLWLHWVLLSTGFSLWWLLLSSMGFVALWDVGSSWTRD